MLGTHGGFHFFLGLPSGLDRLRFLDACRSDGLTLQTAALEKPDAVEHGLVIG